MKFFKDVRCSTYLQGCRMRQDKKTSVRYWNVTVAITMSSKLAHACAEAIVSNYAQISTDENRCGGIDIDEDPPAQRVTFFKLEDAKEPELTLGNWTVCGLRMTKVEGLVELWVTLEHVKTDALHRFMGEFAFTRMWTEFVPNGEAPEAAKDDPVGDGGPVADIGSLVVDRLVRIDDAAKKTSKQSKKKGVD